MVALRRRLHELRADPALRAVLLEVLPARRAQARDQARVKSERESERSFLGAPLGCGVANAGFVG